MGEKKSSITVEGLKSRDGGESKFLYKSWKIDMQPTGSWRCIRIRPTEWFTASSLNAAIKSIDRREAHRAGKLSSLWDTIE